MVARSLGCSASLGQQPRRHLRALRCPRRRRSAALDPRAGRLPVRGFSNAYRRHPSWRRVRSEAGAWAYRNAPADARDPAAKTACGWDIAA
jgi:hypothetical protein